MKKRYDYHSVINIRPLLFGICFATGGLMTMILFIEPTLSGKIFALLLSVVCFVMPFPVYLDRINTYIEVADDGILFQGWEKKIFSTWSQIREIKTLTPIKGSLRYKVFTDKGNFVIHPALEPADQEAVTIFGLIKRGNAKYQNELISEIRNRTHSVKISFAILNRPTDSPTADRALNVLAVLLLIALCCLIAYSVWVTFVR